MLCFLASYHVKCDRAVHPKPTSMYRRMAPWARRIWIAIHFQPPPPLALRTTPRYCLKRHRVEGRQSRRRLKATFRTSGAEGTGPLRAPSSALSRTPRQNLQRFQARASSLLLKGARRLCRDLCPSRGARQSAGSASQRFHRRGAPHYHECGDPEGSVHQERID